MFRGWGCMVTYKIFIVLRRPMRKQRLHLTRLICHLLRSHILILRNQSVCENPKHQDYIQRQVNHNYYSCRWTFGSGNAILTFRNQSINLIMTFARGITTEQSSEYNYHQRLSFILPPVFPDQRSIIMGWPVASKMQPARVFRVFWIMLALRRPDPRFKMGMTQRRG